ncbi:GNAT family N-acetyltransferase (plasmid) [Lichenicola cladoniae]|uniref:GNAT family N-acetyltransferase n=1 Tax=Lichenicola cladoniae TaxID=1484109 RepID=A0A6M8HYR1_9PROT|nr:GNAT family N-acetyltransferase [Lichenicola cladoniae]NPD70191.1 GNAT family N-acetyltransferase [Acetobacteraceae bacterium]QKE93478.1 GNAT family N-acetyltransferase [Lichenicola cladoniae]
MAAVGLVHWRKMVEPDLVSVGRVGDAVHLDYPEDAAIIAERLKLYPAGCLVLDDGRSIRGYTVAHPWFFGRPPPLNSLLGGLPVRADTFYIHDLALVPEVRGGDLGAKAVDLLARRAELDGMTSMSLVAVGSSPRFWRRNGFEVIEREETRAASSSYGKAAFMARFLL